MSTAAVLARGLVREYATQAGPVRALKGVDLRIETGDRLAIMGPSGCGKSTLLSIIGGLEQPSKGTIEVLGTDIGVLSDSERTNWRRMNIGFIFQAYDLLPFLTAVENVALQAGLAGREPVESARKVLEGLGLAEHVDKFPDQLSGGQKQRVGIARCLVHRPKLILADEPTGGLDSATSMAVIGTLLDVADEIGSTVVVVTHDSTVGTRFDNIVLLSDGHVAPANAKADHHA
jgi:ABC-type lipoprotein export system ATPase subunit